MTAFHPPPSSTRPTPTLHPVAVAAAYVTLALLVVTPAADVIVGAWPPDPTDAEWRYHLARSAADHLLLPLSGFLGLLGVAVIRRHRNTARLAGAVTVPGGILLLLAAVIFIADSRWAPDSLMAFPTLLPALKLFAGGTAFILLGSGAWWTARNLIPQRRTSDIQFEMPFES